MSDVVREIERQIFDHRDVSPAALRRLVVEYERAGLPADGTGVVELVAKLIISQARATGWLIHNFPADMAKRLGVLTYRECWAKAEEILARTVAADPDDVILTAAADLVRVARVVRYPIDITRGQSRRMIVLAHGENQFQVVVALALENNLERTALQKWHHHEPELQRWPTPPRSDSGRDRPAE